MKPTRKPLRFARIRARIPAAAGLLAVLTLALLASGCVKNQGAGKNCRCMKQNPTAAAAVKPPTKTPDCKDACKYFVYCQSARWSDDSEQKDMRDRCLQDCSKAKGADAKSQEGVFFGGIKSCAVGRTCVAYGKCMRKVIADLRKLVNGDDEPQEDPNAIYKVPVVDSPTLGPATAPVTVVMFADYQCPFCGRGWKTVSELLKLYPGKIRFVYKHYPLPMHPRGRVAAEAALCVMKQKGLAAFWKFHRRAYTHHEDLSDAKLAEDAKAVGADPAAVKKCYTDGTQRALLTRDLKLGTSLGVSGTPAFFINGKKLSGAQPLDAFKTAYADALKRAEAAIKSGVKPADVYQHLIKDGATKPVYLKGKGPSSARDPQDPPELDPKVAFRIPVTRNDAAEGPADALVTIVVFADFQCPACAVASQRLAQLRKDFPKDVRVVYRHHPLPMHSDAQLAAEAALAVRAQKGDKGFFAYHDKLYANQQDLSRPALERMAKELGVDMARFKKDLDAHTFKAAVERDAKFAQQMGMTGTPALYINGKVIMGVPPYASLKKRIEGDIAAAKLQLKGGVTRTTLYAHLQKDAKTAPVFVKAQ